MKIKVLDNDLKQKLQLCMLTFKLIKKRTSIQHKKKEEQIKMQYK